MGVPGLYGGKRSGNPLNGSSGAELDKVTYCRKWYPRTISVEPGRTETIYDWKQAGNLGSHTRSVMTYVCIQP